MTRVFFDTNVVVYTISTDEVKAARAKDLLEAGGTVSVQVLNEVVSVCLKKARMNWLEVRDVIDVVRDRCEVVPLTDAIHDAAMNISERYGFNVFDACIWAAAQQAGCALIYSEDMQHGQTIDATRLVNPFV